MSNTPTLRWSLPARLLHWGLAISISLDYFLEDDPHNFVGYLALGVIGVRLLWGVRTKFPRANLLANIIYILIWLDVLALAITGWLHGTDRFWGEEWLSETHWYLAQGMLGLIGLHLLGLMMDSVRFRRHTWLRMISGKA